MAQTYLQLINKVLIALREDTVASVNEPYSKLIGQFVNDAKEEIEDSWAWKCLRTEVSFSSTANSSTTTLTSTNERSYVLDDRQGRPQVYKTVSGEESLVSVIPFEDLRQYRLASDAAERTEPSYVAFTSDGTNLIAHFWPTPDATYTYKAVVVIPQAELDDKDDTLTIPWRPVVAKAIYYAMEERGSEFQGRLEARLNQAEQAKGQAILLDMGGEHWTVSEA